MNNISLDTRVLPYRDNLCLLVIHVHSTNPRASKFEFDEKNATFRLDIRLIPDGRDVRTLFEEEEGEHVESVDLIKGSGGYEMLPSASMDDMRSRSVVPIDTSPSGSARAWNDETAMIR
ncbi:hypothetical protein AWB81_08158 [Caballeronia arationis]|jgi:hypothetical protein|uniref:Uncharacterized protein n=1 Tax=Caballeronia arationis TaxID=1777142 RepID=A0A7Z7N086_9BURK|nr:hypothetical protein [Caballeronia arationis]SAL07559.1 hypothetical protein AWB81_08158 [Caballeronia arationis]SOE50732.1 hypothetical protein SAMN05446927_0439 [Caballeronia arationis]